MQTIFNDYKKINYQLLVAIFVLFTTTAELIYADTVKFDATRDVWVSSFSGEENFNMGASHKLKLKGIQEMAILDFDLTLLKGKNVDSARLYLCDAGKNKLRRIGISTVASPWVEGKSRSYSVDRVEGGATFNYSSFNRHKWAGEGSDLSDVTMGDGNTWQYHTVIKREGEDWWSVDIAIPLIQALISEKSYGLLVMDESGQTMSNNYVYSRESKHSSPYMVVIYIDVTKEKPKRPDAELLSADEYAHMDYGALSLRVAIKEELFAFDIYIDNKKVPLWRIPKPRPVNTVQEIIFDWLVPEKKVEIKLIGVDRFGQRSEPSIITGISSKSLPKIAFPAYKPKKGIEHNKNSPSAVKPFLVWAVPEVVKIDPVSGRLISDVHDVAFSRENPVWSEDAKQITLLGLKGEVIGFQLCAEASSLLLDGLEFKAESLKSDQGDEISAGKFSLYQAHYLKVKDKWYPELAIPMPDRKLTIKTDGRTIKNQKNQLIYIDLSIPYDTSSGHYSGNILILKQGSVVESLKLKLQVVDLAMPEELSFVPELNMYKGPAKAGTERFYEAHRIAHEHRTVINRVPYFQDGTIHQDMIPKISYLESGEVTIDWSDYDRRFGPLFEGRAFASGYRDGVPLEKFYLPFFENWPSALAPNYQYEYVGKKSRKTLSNHALEGPELDKALSVNYKGRFAKVIKEFIKHFEEKGWEQTEFQFYLNNKWRWKGSSSWWSLDEPMSYDDWMALQYFGAFFQQTRGSTPVQFIFRADISRPRWQHDLLNGILERMYVQSKAFFKYSNRVRRLKKEGAINFSVYGSLNDIQSSNHETVLSCMRAFVEGAEGVLPWQSLGGPKAFSVPQKNALIVDGREAVGVDWVVSLRVKALRRGQQNVEFLAMLEKKYGYKREQVRNFFYEYFGKENFLEEENTADNNSALRDETNTQKMENFRRILIEMLLNE